MTSAIRPYITKKWGLLTLSWIDIKTDLIFSWVSVRPLSMYLDLPSEMLRYMTTLSWSLYIYSDCALLLLSKTNVTVAFVIPALPYL